MYHHGNLIFCFRKWNKENRFIHFIKYLKILVNQQNSKSNELIKMTRTFHPYLTFTGKPPGSQANLPQVLKLTCPQVSKLTCLQVLKLTCLQVSKLTCLQVLDPMLCLTLLLEFCFYKKLLNFNKMNKPIFLYSASNATIRFPW